MKVLEKKDKAQGQSTGRSHRSVQAKKAQELTYSEFIQILLRKHLMKEEERTARFHEIF